ncbi:class II glutamine amidotransferase [Devosia ginsengisoli]|uniref:class II glutamine amidotransferase n=1 Tax=Devosia ginsengisoli TaxID=400770 RepID=UPI0026EDC0B7|nr:class II glutamine amidotransferase [Devosia ginsengisoli]MCR6671863.1 class II glutamine amidotransferase [Devosia ginsengisoli]
MCRFLAYVGEPVFLDTLLIEPASSLVSQSLAAREAKTLVNGDGCGVGWYGARAEPGVYRGTLPAWSDANLASLSHQVEAPMFLAHVRSATSGEVSMANCHPFAVGRHLFMHNGQIGGYERIRRSVEAMIPDDLYARRRGNGDSEALFLAALGHGLDADPVTALARTLAVCTRMMHANAIPLPLRFTTILADGDSLIAIRWASDDHPPSLYWRQLDTGIAIASEPFGDTSDTWHPVPPGSVMTAAHGDVSFNDFVVA